MQTNSLFFSLFCVSPLKIITKQLFVSDSANIGEVVSISMTSFVAFARLVDQFVYITTGKFYVGFDDVNFSFSC